MVEHFDAFAAVFGSPEGYGIRVKRDVVPEGEALLDSDLAPMETFRVNHWHTDGSALERPPDAALLTPVELPPVGGDTMWASMYAAWEGLSSHHQRLLDGLEAVHGTSRLPFLEPATAVHPVVLRDPVTGRRLLFVNSNWTERIVGMRLHHHGDKIAVGFVADEGKYPGSTAVSGKMSRYRWIGGDPARQVFLESHDP